MKPKKLLKKCRHEKREIIILTQKRDMLRMSLLPSSINIKPDNVQSSPDPDPLGERLSLVHELEKEIDRQVSMMLEHEVQAHKLVGRLDDSIQRQILELYYLSTREDEYGNQELYIWEEVADELGYSMSGMFDLVDKAMETLESVS